jgi:two-component system sensor histidine kinase PrrB
VRLPGSLRARVTLAAVAAVLLGGGLAGGLLLAGVERDGRRAVDEELRERAERIVGRPVSDMGGRGEPPAGGREPLLEGSGTFVQLALGGRVIERRGDVPLTPAPLPGDDGLATVRIEGEPWRSLTASLGPDGQLRLQVLRSLAPVEARVASIRRLVLVLGALALAITALAAWALATLAVRPLSRLREGAALVSGADDLAAPLPDDEGPDEVRSLARTLNEMLARLHASAAAMQRALEATRRFAADAGHELRNPLTALRANLDALARNPDLPVAQRQVLVADLAAEQERMAHLLEGLQALARGEAAESLPREAVEIVDIVDAAVYAARRRHPRIVYELDEDGAADAVLDGWGGGVRLLVDNLLDNAALHGRREGRVRVGLERDGPALVLRVDDDGPGVAPDERDRLLEPFARGRDVRAAGTGLGLAIVAQQVALHRGQLRLGDSPLGGLEVEVRLPTAAPQPAPA